MGNREALLAGAKRCLNEKGYARTTVRDLASSAQVSMAAIGYHFGSREALLNAALIQANEEWGNALAEVLQAETPDASPAERFALIWDRVIASFPEYRRMWAMSFEAYSQADLDPDVREQLADSIELARFGLANLFQGLDDPGDERARAVGTVHQALLSGVMMQWLVDPDRAPSGADLVRGLRVIATDVLT